MFLPNGPIRYLYGRLSHDICGGNDFCIAFDTFVPCEGHIHDFFVLLIHDSGTVAHHLSPIVTKNIYKRENKL